MDLRLYYYIYYLLSFFILYIKVKSPDAPSLSIPAGLSLLDPAAEAVPAPPFNCIRPVFPPDTLSIFLSSSDVSETFAKSTVFVCPPSFPLSSK